MEDQRSPQAMPSYLQIVLAFVVVLATYGLFLLSLATHFPPFGLCLLVAVAGPFGVGYAFGSALSARPVIFGWLLTALPLYMLLGGLSSAASGNVHEGMLPRLTFVPAACVVGLMWSGSRVSATRNWRYLLIGIAFVGVGGIALR